MVLEVHAPRWSIKNKRSRITLWLCILALFIAVLLLRMPFIENPLLGEEGCFARLVLGTTTVASIDPRGFPEMFSGRINGNAVFAPFQRNIMIYMVMDYPARWVGNLLWPVGETFDSITVSARATFLLLFSCGAWVIGWAIARFASGRGFLTLLTAFLLAAYALTSPLMVGASIQPQLDGSVGILFMGFCAFALLKGDESRRDSVLFVLAGIIGGLGRPEWLIAMGGAAVIVTIASSLFPDRILEGEAGGGRTMKWNAVLFVAGLAGGALISIALSPMDFFAGVSVLTRISAATGGNPAMLVQFQQFLVPLGLLSAMALLTGLGAFYNVGPGRAASLRSGQLIVLIGGLAIFVGFAVSGWTSDGFPRYFAPSMLLVTVSAIGLLSAQLPRSATIARNLLIIAGCIYGLYFNATSLLHSYREQVSITSYNGFPLQLARERMAKSNEISQSGHRIVLQSSAFGLYYPNAEFVSIDWGVEGAKGLIRTVAPERIDSFYEPK